MLDSTFSAPFNDEEAYNLALPICSDWKQAKQRILVILQTVDGRDLKAEKLLGDKAVSTCFKNVLKYTKEIARTYKQLGHTTYAVISFNAKRHLHLKRATKDTIEADFAARIHKTIAKLKPTHILVSGPDAMKKLFPSIEHAYNKIGWVHNLKAGDLDVKVTSTLDFAKLLEKKGERANLLGFFCRHFSNLHIGKLPHDLSHIKLETRYVDTISKFDQLYAKLIKEPITAIDTETKDLSVLHNAIYTMQFAFDSDPNVAYILPLKHPMTPWSKEDLKYVQTKLRKFYASKKKRLLVFMNGMYDLRVIRRAFKLPIIWHRAWESTSGEHLLDENISEMKNMGLKMGGLAAIFCSYGNDFYLNKNTKFSKAERNTSGNVKPNDPDFLKYAGMDVVSILHIRKSQIERAEHQFIENKVYKPYFIRHMLYQMSDTAHQLSHLREDGSLVDAKYLKYLTSVESPIRTEMKILSDGLRAYPEAQEANKQIISNSGFKSLGLFGSKVVTWALSFSKPDHLRTLFFDILGLDPVSETKQGTPSVDKEMIAAYKDTNPIVAEYGEYTKLAKLLSTYARGWYKQLVSNNDSITDGHLRPDYSSFDVSTGRLASKNPSLQTIPSRGNLVKIIKRMFIAQRGYMLVRFDYSAHEVRGWSIASGDKDLAAVFKVGQKLRQLFIQNPTDENKKAIKQKGDIHILNVKRLLGKDVDKDHPLRDSIKSIIFGLLYGKSAETLGVDTKTGDLIELKDKIRALTAEIAELEKA